MQQLRLSMEGLTLALVSLQTEGQCPIGGQSTKRVHSCIGYLDHPFEKEDPWAFTARLFLVVKWGLAIEMAGEEFSYTRETTRVWAADHETGLQRWQERPATDLFSHELSAGWTLSFSSMLSHVVSLQAAQR
jgi:hypothetical protein